MATKIRLMRLGKMRAPYYRVVVADSRTKRDGRAIETIGKYHPKEEPSFIQIDNERAIHWLKVGAQPTEAVAALLKITGAWQEFKGEPAPPPMRVKEAAPDKKAIFAEASQAAATEKEATDARRAEERSQRRGGKGKGGGGDAAAAAPAPEQAAAPAEAPAETPADAGAEAPAAEVAAPEAPAAEATATEATATETASAE